MSAAPKCISGIQPLQTQTIYKTYPEKGSETITVPMDCKYVVVNLSGSNSTYGDKLIANISMTGGTVLYQDSHWEQYSSSSEKFAHRSSILVCSDVEASTEISVEWRYCGELYVTYIFQKEK